MRLGRRPEHCGCGVAGELRLPSGPLFHCRDVRAPESDDREQAEQRPLSTETASVNNKTVPSMLMSSRRGSSVGANPPQQHGRGRGERHTAAPPASASTTLSDSSVRVSRPRLAPSAARIASS